MAEQKIKGVVKAVCISPEKGTEKQPVKEAVFIKDFGISNDAHAGKWHRQISLLSYDKVEEFNKKGGNASIGAFGENILVCGIDFKALPVGTLLFCNDVVLRITQIGKKCHSHCNIYQRVGDCIMPREGVFAEVVHEGKIRPGDIMTGKLPDINTPLRAAVITLSDKGYRAERIDTSGPLAEDMLRKAGYEIVEMILLPDEKDLIIKNLIYLADSRQVDLIITTGGTGMSLRDCTPEATLAVATRNVPGISEAMRAASMKITPRAMLSRGVSVLRNNTLIVNLPGSRKAVAESLEFVLPQLEHGLKILKGTVSECGR